MSEMIERVAEAIMKVDAEEKISDYYKWARAAIEAMREPTPSMIGAWDLSDQEDVESVWHQMISEALGKVDA